MGIEDFVSEDESANKSDETTEEDQNLEPNDAIEAIDRNLMEHAKVLTGEPNIEPEGGRVCVKENVIVAERRKLAAVIAIMLTNFDREEFKELEELE